MSRSEVPPTDDVSPTAPWYRGVTPYMWLVLVIASLGWTFDIFEGQIFVASMREAMPALLPAGTDAGIIAFYNNLAMGAFLIGGALGGILFGALSDRIGRTRTLILTILMYSLFASVTAFAQSWWHMVVLRFLVAMGAGGEWAVGCAMIAEVFPSRARAHVGSIFHASGILGTLLATLVGVTVIGNEALGENGWRWAFALGAAPALLTLWIRWKLREPEQWVQARRRASEDPAQRTGHLADLFKPGLLSRTVLGVSLAAIGIATFWGVHIYGKDLTLKAAQTHYLSVAGLAPSADAQAQAAALSPYTGKLKNAEMLGMFLVTIGGGVGQVLFGPICSRMGRRGAFILYHLGSVITSLVVFQYLHSAPMTTLCLVLPIFGFMTLGLHAGYAVYFPELYPTRLRGTGSGFCFNVGRLFAATILLIIGWMRRPTDAGGLGLTLENTASILSLLFLVGVVLLLFAPETKGRELPE